MIKRRIKSVTAPKKHRKVVAMTPELHKKRLLAKLRYKKNRTKILKAAKLRRQHMTLAEKQFNKRRAAFLRAHKVHI